jgi:hypothetical protein
VTAPCPADTVVANFDLPLPTLNPGHHFGAMDLGI